MVVCIEGGSTSVIGLTSLFYLTVDKVHLELTVNMDPASGKQDRLHPDN